MYRTAQAARMVHACEPLSTCAWCAWPEVGRCALGGIKVRSNQCWCVDAARTAPNRTGDPWPNLVRVGSIGVSPGKRVWCANRNIEPKPSHRLLPTRAFGLRHHRAGRTLLMSSWRGIASKLPKMRLWSSLVCISQTENNCERNNEGRATVPPTPEL